MSLFLETHGDSSQFNSSRNYISDEAMYERAGVPADKILYYTHVKYLNEIKNKSLVISALCSKSHSLFSRIRTFINIPLILSSGAMTILNSMNDTDATGIKYANIVLNSCTVTILSLINNFKLTERELTYRQTHIKMKKLYHRIDNVLNINPVAINVENVGDITKEYVNIYEHLEYPIPNFVIRQFNKENASITEAKNKSDNYVNNNNGAIFNANLTFADNLLNNKNFAQIVC